MISSDAKEGGQRSVHAVIRDIFEMKPPAKYLPILNGNVSPLI